MVGGLAINVIIFTFDALFKVIRARRLRSKAAALSEEARELARDEMAELAVAAAKWKTAEASEESRNVRRDTPEGRNKAGGTRT